MKLIKGCHEEGEYILIIFNFLLVFWRSFACPLHTECSLSLLVNQFRGSWIPFQVGLWRGNSDLIVDV